MQKLFSTFVLLATASLCSVSNADLVYQIENHATDQNGQSVFGTITTTDNAINDGVLQAFEIVSWQWMTTGPNGSSVSSSDVDATLQINGDVRIDSQAITLEQPGIMSAQVFSLEIGSNADGRMSWHRDEFFGSFTEIYQGANAWSTTSPLMSNTDPWLIATQVVAVPEPSSMTYVAVLAMFALNRRNRR